MKPSTIPALPDHGPGFYSIWAHYGAYQRPYTSKLFSPMDEIHIPEKQDRHVARPKEPIAPGNSTLFNETPAQITSGIPYANKSAIATTTIQPRSTDPIESATSLSTPATIDPTPPADPIDPVSASKAFPFIDDSSDWVDFRSYKRLPEVEFLTLGHTRMRVSPPPDSQSRLARIMRSRTECAKAYDAGTSRFRPFDMDDQAVAAPRAILMV
ncbi:hypothetical protein P691DRAFT_811238 [Macrolepiota fuliginosa MF-IS2]|uniref:Uncharacterized protein n=1 Tax=Macrolepiota fuliginosa MF-IS2 TaxID=1400762 RepID=A0A9P5X0C6_9AGAR|nr:hypothetical protein P691DRAFT_811238 [Macrolepiota fuliginosa MF-IS2]